MFRFCQCLNITSAGLLLWSIVDQDTICGLDGYIPSLSQTSSIVTITIVHKHRAIVTYNKEILAKPPPLLTTAHGSDSDPFLMYRTRLTIFVATIGRRRVPYPRPSGQRSAQRTRTSHHAHPRPVHWALCALSFSLNTKPGPDTSAITCRGDFIGGVI